LHVISIYKFPQLCYFFLDETVTNLVFERKLIRYEVVAESGQVMFMNTWDTAVKHSSIWLPLLCGFLATYFTWMCVYLDSKEPGVNPP